MILHKLFIYENQGAIQIKAMPALLKNKSRKNFYKIKDSYMDQHKARTNKHIFIQRTTKFLFA